MKLLIDTREQHPLEFPKMQGVEVLRQGLAVGDYQAVHGEGIPDPTVVERKSLADLFSSFTSGYEQEKAKWTRAKEAGLTYLLAIEGSVSDVLAGHCYWKDGEQHESKKSGLAMLRQLCSLHRRYGLQVLFFTSRKEMALYLQEYFLAQERKEGATTRWPASATSTPQPSLERLEKVLQEFLVSDPGKPRVIAWNSFLVRNLMAWATGQLTK